MALHEFTTRNELQTLLGREIEGERRERPENNFLENTLKIAIAGEFTATNLEIFGYPDIDTQYIFFVEHSDIQYPYIHVRKPLTGHSIDLLDKAVRLLIERKMHLFLKYSQILIVGDKEAGEAFDRHLYPVTGKRCLSEPTNENGIFYMTAARREELLLEGTDAPEGFIFEKVVADRDGELVHSKWRNRIDLQLTKNRLRYLPSLCARTQRGELVGWAMSARFGQVSNVFVLPDYRKRGIGKALELSVAKEFARRGMRVFKYVEASNTPVYERSLQSPLWTLWMDDDEEGQKKPMLNYWRVCRLVES